MEVVPDVLLFVRVITQLGQCVSRCGEDRISHDRNAVSVSTACTYLLTFVVFLCCVERGSGKVVLLSPCDVSFGTSRAVLVIIVASFCRPLLLLLRALRYYHHR